MTTEKNRESGSALPGKYPNSIANPVPQKPGVQSINPAGRPKGSRNIRTILDKMLHRYVDVEEIKHLQGIDATVELCKQLCDAKNDTRQDGDPKERARLYDLIVAAQFTRALQENDLPSFRELVDRYEGAVAQKFEDVTPLKNRDTHLYLDGKASDSNGYLHVDGERAKYPGGFSDPALSVNCRCALRAALPDEKANSFEQEAPSAQHGLGLRG